MGTGLTIKQNEKENREWEGERAQESLCERRKVVCVWVVVDTSVICVHCCISLMSIHSDTSVIPLNRCISDGYTTRDSKWTDAARLYRRMFTIQLLHTLDLHTRSKLVRPMVELYGSILSESSEVKHEQRKGYFPNKKKRNGKNTTSNHSHNVHVELTWVYIK